MTEYILTQDDCGRYYVIPADKEKEWSDYLNAVMAYWDQEFIDDENGVQPIEPVWVDPVGGSPSRVKFKSYRID